ncbi:MAG: DUF4870 domain-containing protein [Flavobacteriales bacterium]
MTESKYYNLEQPEEISISDREDAMGSYLMMFGALAVGLPLPIINLIASVVYYILNAKKSRFIKFHALQSMWSQLPTTLMNAGLIFWTFAKLIPEIEENPNVENFEFLTADNLYWGYLISVIIANLLYVIFSIIGAVKARKGEMYYFMFFGKLAYHMAYKKKDESKQSITNLPPK